MGNSQSALEKAVAATLDNNDKLYAFPSDPLYSQAHVKRYNLDIPTTPLAVTTPKTVAQVSAIVKLAAAHNLKVQAKGGGHSYGNFCDPNGGIVVDLQNFKKFEYDKTTQRCRIGAGMLLGELTKKMYEPHRRAMAHGTCPQVGIGGHATIGGLGPSSRQWGSALDHVEEVQIVIASGEVLKANEKENSDIFWAVRGAGASFGIITEFVVRTEAAPGDMIQYSYSFTTGSWSDMSKTFKAWQKYVSQPNLTWKLASTATVTEVGLTISGTFYGTQAEYDALMLAKEFPGNQTTKTLKFTDYLALVVHWGEDVALTMMGGVPSHIYTKSLTFNHCNQIPDHVIDEMFRYFEETDKGTLLWFAIFDLEGGYINTIPQDATAYAHRDALFYLQSYAINPLGKVTTETKNFLKGLNTVIKDGMAKVGESTDLGAYAGYVDPELPNAQKEYWRTNLPRLEEIKLKYDAGDLFHNLQSVRPGGKEVMPVVEKAKEVASKKGISKVLAKCFG